MSHFFLGTSSVVVQLMPYPLFLVWGVGPDRKFLNIYFLLVTDFTIVPSGTPSWLPCRLFSRSFLAYLPSIRLVCFGLASEKLYEPLDIFSGLVCIPIRSVRPVLALLAEDASSSIQ